MSAREHIEIELKFDVDAGRAVPDLSGLPGVDSVTGPVEENLDATYFDTENLDLTDHRITLRRRIGGHDEGWHLKRPGNAGGRRELQAPLGPLTADGDLDATVPEDILDPVRVHVRGRRLDPIATIATRRLISEARDADDRVLAVLCADIVTADSLLPGGSCHTWAEWEFELVEGGRELLPEAEALLRGAGARTASAASKLARAIGATPAHSGVPRLTSSPTALELVVAELARHREQLVDVDPRVRADEEDAVHQMRVATRRLRSVLRAFRGVIDGPKVDRLDAELKELASILGVVRDAEVTAERYRDLLADEDASETVRDRLVGEQLRRRSRGQRSAVAALNSSRYFSLLDALDDLLVRPPAGADAEMPAKKALRDAVRGSAKKVRKAQATADGLETDSADWVEQMHTVRKRAKRLRYVADSGASLGTRKYAATASAAKKIQSALGDSNDASLSRELIAEVVHSVTDPADAFVLGRLDAREQAAHDAALRTYERVAESL
ncbi:CYTH and CHAD domain-containing protein [Williamsia deligens]|uniref:CHAD domain-containing protein n=1 Tax=Williamsia deligens TaxID=321325 RepID=A0ABW3GA47_9NOCA|nr:CYTH and CHAD domain-containing protein [Williamsia deligens]MCP2195791.1 CHAD domain-containing protein [Williamsia deligens]